MEAVRVCESNCAGGEVLVARHDAATWTLTSACDFTYARLAAAKATAGSTWLIRECEAEAVATLAGLCSTQLRPLGCRRVM